MATGFCGAFDPGVQLCRVMRRKLQSRRLRSWLKVSRDREALELSLNTLATALPSTKGYGTAEHLAALERLGPTPAHRHSFAPVRMAATQGKLW